MASKTTPTYTDEQWTAMLLAGARQQDVNNIHAAVHLLTFTDLPRHWQFAEHVHISAQHLRDQDGRREETPTMTAVVVNWSVMPNLAERVHMSSSDYNLLTLAAVLATGGSTDLRQILTGFGHANARRATEAILIATGYREWYELTPTPRLAAHQRAQRELSGETTQVPDYSLDIVGRTSDRGDHPETGVQFAVTDPDGEHHVYGDQVWVADGRALEGHPAGKIQRRNMLIVYGPWTDHDTTA